MENRFLSPLKRAISVLENSGYRYAIIGGLALAQWSIIRATGDIDIKVWVPDMNYEELRSIIRAAFPKNARSNVPENPFIVSVIIDDITVDFLLTIPGHDELIVNRAIPREISGDTYWICSSEDLIIQKMVAGRGKDLLDVEAMLSVQKGRLDYAYIEKWLSEYDKVLDERHLLNYYHLLMDKIKPIPGNS